MKTDCNFSGNFYFDDNNNINGKNGKNSKNRKNGNNGNGIDKIIYNSYPTSK
jgi:hypothetical protein